VLLSERVVLVTGGSRGIGAAIACELAAHGAFVVVNYEREAAAAAEVVADIERAGGRAESVCCDVADRAAVSEMVGSIERRHGRLDALVNNAGILRDRSFVKMTEDDWNAVLSVNMMGAVNACSAAAPLMIARGYGRIVNISSFVAQAGNFGQTNYAAAKAGLIGFTRSLALEMARHGITVNAVCPGFIATGMWQSIPEGVREKLIGRIPLGRVGQPSDIAAMVRFLVAEAGYVTGQTLNVNGGVYIG
jgi:acetoacetyl-CoA reductase